MSVERDFDANSELSDVVAALLALVLPAERHELIPRLTDMVSACKGVGRASRQALGRVNRGEGTSSPPASCHRSRDNPHWPIVGNGTDLALISGVVPASVGAAAYDPEPSLLRTGGGHSTGVKSGRSATESPRPRAAAATVGASAPERLPS
jgi:hypothetical protein